MTGKKTPITVARGDGIGPDIMDVTLRVLEGAGAQIDIEEVEIGEQVYLRGHETGIEGATWDSIRRTKVFLKAPITTPQGGGFKSLNVTVRTTLGLYANVRPCASLHPYVATKHPEMDLVIIRENEEDLYAGIEYRQSRDVCQSLKVISRSGSEKIIRYAFEYARANGRKKVTCFTKDNIMKFSDGLFHEVYRAVAEEYPEIENEHWIIDIGAAKMADTPEAFDVIVLPNLYGDILSDVAAQISGSVGMVGSSNIGEHGAMFEAIHGSAPRRAGCNMANPSGLLRGAMLMLVHIGQPEVAEKIHNAWLKTLEDGVHTYDIFKEGVSTEKVGTKEFGDAIIERLGQLPTKLKAVSYSKVESDGAKSFTPKTCQSSKELMGVDVFVDAKTTADDLHKKVAVLSNGDLSLKLITNRGVKVWPDGMAETSCIDEWRCRFMAPGSSVVAHSQVVELLSRFSDADIDFTKTEHLYHFDGVAGYTLADVK